MKAELHSLAWPTADPRLAEHQAAVFRQFQLPLRQHCIQVDHGAWMDAVLAGSRADVVLFVDNDCVPLSRKVVLQALRYAAEQRSFLGLAQASNHINGGRHVFAAPAFLAVSRMAWKQLGRPSCRSNPRADVAEELSWCAEEQGLTYRAWYPTHYHHASSEGLWRLGHYGHFGIGSVFAERVFHLYQGRFAHNVDLFVQVCDQVCAGSFSTSGFRSCLDHPAV